MDSSEEIQPREVELTPSPVLKQRTFLAVMSALLTCQLEERPNRQAPPTGSAVTFEHAGRRANFHRPHPGKEALRYRIKAVREFIEKIGVEP